MTTEQNYKVKSNNRTTMYSYDDKGRVVVHHMPFDRNNPFGMKKISRYLEMGYTFQDPRGMILAEPPKEVIVEAASSTISQPEPVGKAPLYVSDKPDKPKKAKRKSHISRS
uniref:Uncharacterized protein n=1 Tax=viral metagenome TaxID=1070528 RepID=A0A6M3JP58_9ZZZZ